MENLSPNTNHQTSKDGEEQGIYAVYITMVPHAQHTNGNIASHYDRARAKETQSESSK